MIVIDPAAVAWAAQLACLYEATADKPGNVSPAASFHDTTYGDFVASAVAVGPAFAAAADRPVGETVLRAVTDTRRLVATNTNLGIVLLLAPLARAAGAGDPAPTHPAAAPAPAPTEAAVTPDAAASLRGDRRDHGTGGLRARAAAVLDELTVADARAVYAAIRAAEPAGMGMVAEADVAEAEPDVTLREAMELARARDGVAREYCTAYEVTFGLAHPALREGWAAGATLSSAITDAFLRVLAEVPDTLIARKHGSSTADAVSRRAAQVVAAGGCGAAAGREGIRRLDAELRDPSHSLNPGTTADLVCAALFVFLIGDGMICRVPELSARR